MKGNKTKVNSLATRRCKAATSFGGIAMSVQTARYTAGRRTHKANPLASTHQDALAVLGRSCVSAVLWKLYSLS